MIIYQRPNLLLVTGLVLLVLSKLPTNLKLGFGVASSLVLAAWAIDEIRSGVNWFRRLLGAVVLIAIFFGLLRRVS